MAGSWFEIRRDLSPGRSLLLKVASFLLPLAAWCVVSYVPFVWHPMVRVTDPGASSYLQPGMLTDRVAFARENDGLAAAGRAVATGTRANPVFLPAPHDVVTAFYKAFVTPPQRRGEPWLHQSLAHSL